MAFSSGFSVRGRCSTQTLSLASIAMLEGSPSFHCGGTFGQARSTSNTGRLRDSAACTVAAALESHFCVTLAAPAIAIRATQVRYLPFIVSSPVAVFRTPIVMRAGHRLGESLVPWPNVQRGYKGRSSLSDNPVYRQQ